MSSFYISAAHKSSGKTTLSIGLSAAIRQRGLSIQAFKKGPDYIDPIWLSQATGNACHNLDFFTSGHDFIVSQFHQYSRNKDVVLVEGNMGLFDGLSLDGADCNAAMAKLLQLPVILVVDTSGSSRGIAPLLNGYQSFDTEIEYTGVILNKIAGKRHESKLRNVIEAYTDFNILGAVPRNSDIQLTERHLGLIPSYEMSEDADSVIRVLAEQVKQFIDLDTILTLPPVNLEKPVSNTFIPSLPDPQIRIAVPMDKAFGFYYPGDLKRFKQLGVEIVPFSTISDKKLPGEINGLFIGGGFPETQIKKLSANHCLQQDIQKKIAAGLPAYAECGGLMYLCTNLIENNESYPLCDVIPATVNMNKKPQGRGYVILQPTQLHPWYKGQMTPYGEIRAHEFHYSAIHSLPDVMNYAYSVKRGTGIDGLNDGIILYNLVASYTHLRRTDQCSWVEDFISFVKKCET